jgi:tetratricopeptide (TPR) repeat protein
MKPTKRKRTLLIVAVFVSLCVVCFGISRLSPPSSTVKEAGDATSAPTKYVRASKTPGPPTSTPLPSAELFEALEQGDVTVEIYGSRQVAGESMIMEITRLVGGPLEVTIEPGTVLYTSRSGYQNMLVTSSAQIELLDMEPQQVSLHAYCMNAALKAPTEDVAYTAGRLESPELEQLVQALPAIKREDYYGQGPLLGAIWSITDNISITDIRKRLMYGYDAVDMVRAKLIVEKAGIDTVSKFLFNPQNSSETAIWHGGWGDYLLYVERDYSGAVAEYTKAIEAQPSASHYQKRAYAHERNQDYEAALSDLDRAMELEPLFVFHKDKAEIHIEMGAFDLAIEDYGNAIEIAEENYELETLYRDRAELCMEQEYYDQAIADYSVLIDMHPEREWLYHDRARAYIAIGSYELAVADYSAAIEIKPDWDLNYWSRGRAYKALGAHDEAIADFEKVIELDGSWVSAAERELEELKGE